MANVYLIKPKLIVFYSQLRKPFKYHYVQLFKDIYAMTFHFSTNISVKLRNLPNLTVNKQLNAL